MVSIAWFPSAWVEKAVVSFPPGELVRHLVDLTADEAAASIAGRRR